MVIYSKKSKGPREVSLLAIPDALNIHNATSAATSPAMEGPNQALGTCAQRSESIVQLPQRRRPARAPFYIASLFTALWLVGATMLIVSFGRQLSETIGWGATLTGIAGGVGAAIVFFYALAHMMARSNELRVITNSMAEATLRFAEPESVARDSMVSIGQAIRREVAAMGDGLERALARAAELETLVNNEVAALERAYNDNERRIRDLLDGLAQQREMLVGQAGEVRNAITNVHLDLSHDITTISKLIAERVNEAAQRITRSLAEKGEQITVALGTAGDNLLEQFSQHGVGLLQEFNATRIKPNMLSGAHNSHSDRPREEELLAVTRLSLWLVALALPLASSLINAPDGRPVGGAAPGDAAP
jgi:hypothetical protein